MSVATRKTSDARIIAHVDMDCFYVQGNQFLFLLLSFTVHLFFFLWFPFFLGGFIRVRQWVEDR